MRITSLWGVCSALSRRDPPVSARVAREQTSTSPFIPSRAGVTKIASMMQGRSKKKRCRWLSDVSRLVICVPRCLPTLPDAGDQFIRSRCGQGCMTQCCSPDGKICRGTRKRSMSTWLHIAQSYTMATPAREKANKGRVCARACACGLVWPTNKANARRAVRYELRRNLTSPHPPRRSVKMGRLMPNVPCRPFCPVRFCGTFGRASGTM